MREIVVDSFAGWGGASLGIERGTGRPVDKAINHDEKAVLMLENVPEFLDWGPLGPDDMPLKERKGETFRLWVWALREAGYTVEWNLLVAADYGAPTIRKRLFVVARRDGRPIRWPTATHAKNGMRGLLRWRAAAECIQWELPTPSIFLTKEEGRAVGVRRPLAPATERRIASGMDRYVLRTKTPFIVNLTHGGRVEDLAEPFNVITGAHRGEKAIVVPFTAGVGGRAGQSPARDVAEPFGTMTAKADTVLIAPSLVQTGYGEREGQTPRSLDIQQPIGTIVGGGQKHAMVAAFLAAHYGASVGSQMDAPMGAVTGFAHHSLVVSSMVEFHGTAIGQSMEEPMGTISAGGQHHGEVRAYLQGYYSSGGSQEMRLTEPLHTISTHDRFGLVVVEGRLYEISDIGMRMLAPRELARGQGFPDDYTFGGLTKTDSVRMVGNSVCPDVAEALVLANEIGLGQGNLWQGYELAAVGGE